MGLTLTAEKQEFEAIATGEYLAEFIDYEEETGQYGEQVKMIWEITKPTKYAGKTRFDWCNKKLSKGSKSSKLWSRIEALMNRPIDMGEHVDIDALLHRSAILVIVEEPKEDGTSNSKIAAVKAYKKQEPFVAGTKAAPRSDDFESGEPEEEDPFSEE
jgi:hypothetical protein